MVSKEKLVLIVSTILLGKVYRDSCPRWTTVGARCGQLHLEMRFYNQGQTKLLLYQKSKQHKGKLVDISL